MLPNSVLPFEISEKVREAGRVWAACGSRPRLDARIRDHWDSLIQDWADSDLPLAVRKSGGIRGAVRNHSSGRKIILTDNSCAQWAFGRAFSGLKYSVNDIRELLQRDEIPFPYATKSVEKEKMTYKCTLRPGDNLNKCGWKLCHIDDVGLSTRTPPEQLPLDTLIRHFCLLLKPSNHFLVPLTWAGFGELPEVIEEVRKAETASTV